MTGANAESNRSTLIGREYPGAKFVVSKECAEAYAASYDDTNSRYRGAAAIAPPMSAVIYAMKFGVAPAMGDPELIGDPSRLMRLLHGEQEIRWRRPVKIGETLDTVGFVKDIQDKSSGQLIEIGTRSLDVTGAPVVEMTWGLFIRSEKGDKTKTPSPTPSIGRAPDFGLSWAVAADQSLRYADASGDLNPIHTNDEIARMVGLKGKILHGLCTMAFAQRAIVDTHLAGDATRLRRMRVRFTRPVYPGETLTLNGRIVEKVGTAAQLAFDVRGPGESPVLKDGTADVD